MNPISFFGQTTQHVAPKGWSEEQNGRCRPLPTKVETDGRIVSVWEPSPMERLRLQNGWKVVLTCFGTQPPVSLVVAPVEPIGETIVLGDGDWEAFQAALNEPPKPNWKLRDLLRDLDIWMCKPWMQKPSVFSRIKRVIAAFVPAPVIHTPDVLYRDKCKRLRTDGPTPCLCCEGDCVWDEYKLPNPEAA